MSRSDVNVTNSFLKILSILIKNIIFNKRKKEFTDCLFFPGHIMVSEYYV